MNTKEKLFALLIATLFSVVTVWLILRGLGWLMPIWKSWTADTQRTVQLGFYSVFALVCLAFTVRQLRKRRGSGEQEQTPPQ
ncbi:hypothetical protein [Chitinimonas sp.]|uniref:hypothetical protein n=1 Tax=Chitinimonas sp. TaxID=1934313 RepID=UPI0035B28732